MKKQLLIAVLVGTMATVSGCASGHQVDSSKVDTIQKNVTTESQVRAMFGEPTATQINTQRNQKILSYSYDRNNGFAKTAASTTGAIAGGILAGKNIGSGTGRYVSSALGAMFGSYLGREAVGNDREIQTLDVMIDTQTHRVTDYNYVLRQSH